MEPPIGYGSAYRSISPESHFRTTTGSDFSRLGSWVFTRIGFCLACSFPPRCRRFPWEHNSSLNPYRGELSVHDRYIRRCTTRSRRSKSFRSIACPRYRSVLDINRYRNAAVSQRIIQPHSDRRPVYRAPGSLSTVFRAGGRSWNA